jgi:hypothetical protein
MSHGPWTSHPGLCRRYQKYANERRSRDSTHDELNISVYCLLPLHGDATGMVHIRCLLILFSLTYGGRRCVHCNLKLSFFTSYAFGRRLTRRSSQRVYMLGPSRRYELFPMHLRCLRRWALEVLSINAVSIAVISSPPPRSDDCETLHALGETRGVFSRKTLEDKRQSFGGSRLVNYVMWG